MSLSFMIVEDEPITARFIHEILESQGCHVAGIAKNGEEARTLFEKNHIDIVLMDINIQGNEDGIQLSRSFKNDNLAIIFMSAYSDKQTLVEAANTMPYGFLVKPFNEADLLAVLHVSMARLKNINSINTIKKSNKADFDNYKLNRNNNQLIYHDEIIHLSKNETKCIAYFFENSEQEVSMDVLRHVIWDNKPIGDSAIRELINRIRNKTRGLKIESIYGIGYILKK
jgi:DNA-binding response OmpR family regulator